MSNKMPDKQFRTNLFLQAEAAIYIMFSRIILRIMPFSRIAKMLVQTSAKRQLTGCRRRLACLQVKTAIFKIWQRYPSSNTCIHRALAAYWMLRRRGVATTLYYGAKTCAERGLTGHVWLMDGSFGVVGFDASKSY